MGLDNIKRKYQELNIKPSINLAANIAKEKFKDFVKPKYNLEIGNSKFTNLTIEEVNEYLAKDMYLEEA